MKSFLVKNKIPTIKWGSIPHGIYFQGEVPEGYKLAVCPSKDTIIVDVDVHGEPNGYDNLPDFVLNACRYTLHYKTKSGGLHIWLKYPDHQLLNKTSGLGMDLRTNKGYVCWYTNGRPENRQDEVWDLSFIEGENPEIFTQKSQIRTWLNELFL